MSWPLWQGFTWVWLYKWEREREREEGRVSLCPYPCKWLNRRTWILLVVYCWTGIHRNDLALFKNPVVPKNAILKVFKPQSLVLFFTFKSNDLKWFNQWSIQLCHSCEFKEIFASIDENVCKILDLCLLCAIYLL